MVQYRVLNPALLRREVGLASDIVRELRPGAALPFCCVSARGCETCLSVVFPLAFVTETAFLLCFR